MSQVIGYVTFKKVAEKETNRNKLFLLVNETKVRECRLSHQLTSINVSNELVGSESQIQNHEQLIPFSLILELFKRVITNIERFLTIIFYQQFCDEWVSSAAVRHAIEQKRWFLKSIRFFLHLSLNGRRFVFVKESERLKCD